MAKKTVKTQDVVNGYAILKTVKIGKLDKADQFKVFRNARALKPVATAFDDFVTDARERLKPEGFDEIVEKSQRFKTLSDEERADVNVAIMKHNKEVEDCVRAEAEKEVEIEVPEGLGESALSTIATENNLDVQSMMLLMDLCE